MALVGCTVGAFDPHAAHHPATVIDSRAEHRGVVTATQRIDVQSS
jgi:hypothetical protein